MTTSRPVRGLAVLAAGALTWGLAAGPAAADSIRQGQWAISKYNAAELVWPISQGEGVTVAVIDTGVQASHQDLTGQVLAGADFSGENTDGRTDRLGHGTEMASMIAAHGHGDQAGIIGLAPKAKILPVRVALDDDGNIASGGETKLADAIRYAVDHHAQVISMSMGSSGLRTNPDARAAVRYAASKDVVLVAATGNQGDHQAPVSYPAAFPGVVAVGAVDQSGTIWNKSNSGPETTLVAPGVGVYGASNKSDSSYGNGTGTSASTAYVSAIAALIRSKYPQLSAGQVINRMIKTAKAPQGVTALPDPKYGYGIASPSKALAANPAVDQGPKENPLASRPESQGAPDSGAAASPSAGAQSTAGAAPVAAGGSGGGGGLPWHLIGAGGAVVVLAVVGGVLVMRRSRRTAQPAAAAPVVPGAPQYPGQYTGQPGQYSAQPGPYQGQPGQYPTPPGQYPPQGEPPAGGNPYQR
ncbi:type VII secretion-associated serine protease mycosin [Kitasatospora sp. NPDC002227]|uniref:type VII secretion-associated serine protease mycosin n=1 Tax=Kitasatospora sp. NPDC002227 TaxID=3154773 RepID=UPI003328B0B3